MSLINRLPPEIFQQIFHELRDLERTANAIFNLSHESDPSLHANRNIQGLTACPLVCKLWIGPARAALFQKCSVDAAPARNIPYKEAGTPYSAIVSLEPLCKALENNWGLSDLILSLDVAVNGHGYNIEDASDNEKETIDHSLALWKRALNLLPNLRRIGLLLKLRELDDKTAVTFLTALDDSPASKAGKFTSINLDLSANQLRQSVAPAFSFYSTLSSLYISFQGPFVPEPTILEFHPPSLVNLSKLSLSGHGVDDSVLEAFLFPESNPLRERLLNLEIDESNISAQCALQVLPGLKVRAFVGDDLRPYGSDFPESLSYPYDTIVPQLPHLVSLGLAGQCYTKKIFKACPETVESLRLSRCNNLERKDVFGLLEGEQDEKRAVLPNLRKLELYFHEEGIRHGSWDDEDWLEALAITDKLERDHSKVATDSATVRARSPSPDEINSDTSEGQLVDIRVRSLERALRNGPRASKLDYHTFVFYFEEEPTSTFGYTDDDDDDYYSDLYHYDSFDEDWDSDSDMDMDDGF